MRGITRAFGHGVRVGRLGRRGRVFYGVRRGRVRWVAVATGSVGKTPRRLRSYLRLAHLR